MATLTVNIDDHRAEQKVRALLDKLGLNYLIDVNNTLYKWWEDELLIQELDKRSEDLKSGRDKGVSFIEARQRISSK